MWARLLTNPSALRQHGQRVWCGGILERRWLRTLINSRQLKEAFKYYLESRKDGEGNESILFNCIKSCATGLRTVRAHRRVVLADDIISTLKEKGVPLSVQIQNCLLQVYINNHHGFSPSAFLENMKEENISPNRGTLFLLLHAYCQHGNMEGAKEILQEIQANEILINEDVYASLITCYAMSKKMDEAREMLQVMRENGLEPKQSAYSALLSGYAYHGDLESVKEMIETMKDKQRLFAGHGMYIDMIDALSRGGHSDGKMDTLLDMIQNKQWMYTELIDKMQVIAGRGDLPGTLSLLECLCNIGHMDDKSVFLKTAAGGAFSLLLSSNLPLSLLLSSMSVFDKAEVPRKDCYENIIHKAFREKEWGDLKLTLKDMATRDVAIKGIYVYPPLANISLEKNIEDLMEWLSLCKSLNVTPDMQITNFCFTTFGHDMMLMLKKLSESDVLLYVLPNVLQFICVHGNEEQVKMICQYLQQATTVSVFSLIEAVKTSLSERIHPKPFTYMNVIKALSLLCKTEEELSTLSDIIHLTVSQIVYRNKSGETFTLLESLWGDSQTAGLVKPETSTLALSTLAYRKLVDEFHKLLKLMYSHGRQLECEGHFQVIKIASVEVNPNLAMSSFKAMRQQGCSIPPYVFAKLIEVTVKGKHHREAMLVYKIMRDMRFKPSLKVSNVLINGLLSIGNVSDALSVRNDIEKAEVVPTLEMFNAFIEAYGERGDIDKSNEEFQLLKGLGLKPSLNTYEMLMKGYCYHGDVTSATGIVQEAIASGLGTSRLMVSSLLETYINAKDIEGAVAYLESLDDIRPKVSLCIQLVNECEMKRRRDLTEKTLAFITSIGRDQEEIDCIFVFALLRTGQSIEALEFSKEKKLSMSSVERSADIFSKTGNVQDIRLGIQLLDQLGLPSLSLYKSLIRAHAHNNDRESILAVKSELETNELKKPDVSFYTLLHHLLCDPAAGREND